MVQTDNILALAIPKKFKLVNYLQTSTPAMQHVSRACELHHPSKMSCIARKILVFDNSTPAHGFVHMPVSCVLKHASNSLHMDFPSCEDLTQSIQIKLLLC